MELEAEEENKTPIIKFGEGSWNRTSSKACFHPSFLSSFCKYSWIVFYVLHNMLGTHMSMNELLSQIRSYQVIKIHQDHCNTLRLKQP